MFGTSVSKIDFADPIHICALFYELRTQYETASTATALDAFFKYLPNWLFAFVVGRGNYYI